MGKGRMDDAPFDPIKAPAVCVDCDAEFTATMYPGDTMGTAFVRDHPQNGCHVKARRTVATKAGRSYERLTDDTHREGSGLPEVRIPRDVHRAGRQAA